ncbi:unnamed protein product [Moneuplotes crassus]|uniref:Uncharacterized protein n=2 Tax=Euplotes crassus TaxID=5936 RepID=A0AAD1U2Y1_EUPCR|nr:unnamed protein product [Moneuplotes crassus]
MNPNTPNWTEPQKSFIQIKDIEESIKKESNLCNQSRVEESLNTPLAIAQTLNQGNKIDLATLDSSLREAQTSLNQQIILIKVLENAKAKMVQQQISKMTPNPDMFSLIPKGSNIFAPKPMHAKVELGRIGRSRSMYVTNNPLKTELETGEKSVASDKRSEEENEISGNKDPSEAGTNRKRMNVFKCPHKDRKHYAKNMCNNCYHKLGRNKKATACPHTDRQNYAKGKCQNCYLNDYHKNKRKQIKQALLAEEEKKGRTVSVETSNSDGVKAATAPVENPT